MQISRCTLSLNAFCKRRIRARRYKILTFSEAVKMSPDGGRGLEEVGVGMGEEKKGGRGERGRGN